MNDVEMYEPLTYEECRRMLVILKANDGVLRSYPLIFVEYKHAKAGFNVYCCIDDDMSHFDEMCTDTVYVDINSAGPHNKLIRILLVDAEMEHAEKLLALEVRHNKRKERCMDLIRKELELRCGKK